MVITERVSKPEAAAFRELLDAHVRVSYSEKPGWFSVLFTISTEEPWLSRLEEDLAEFRHQQFLDRHW